MNILAKKDCVKIVMCHDEFIGALRCTGCEQEFMQDGVTLNVSNQISQFFGCVLRSLSDTCPRPELGQFLDSGENVSVCIETKENNVEIGFSLFHEGHCIYDEYSDENKPCMSCMTEERLLSLIREIQEECSTVYAGYDITPKELVALVSTSSCCNCYLSCFPEEERESRQQAFIDRVLELISKENGSIDTGNKSDTAAKEGLHQGEMFYETDSVGTAFQAVQNGLVKDGCIFMLGGKCYIKTVPDNPGLSDYGRGMEYMSLPKGGMDVLCNISNYQFAKKS